MTVSNTIEVHGGFVVGHDGSAHATAALGTAMRFAAALTAHVTVVRAWSFSTAPRPESWAPGYMPPLEDFEASCRSALENDVAEARERHPDVRITTTVVHGSPAEKLIEASRSAEMVVVGSRGHGGFAGLLLGSVSEQVVRHASCAVLVEKRVDGHPNGPASNEHERMERALASELKLD
jgi:nucleotide-binding universal stress UspA family protein